MSDGREEPTTQTRPHGATGRPAGGRRLALLLGAALAASVAGPAQAQDAGAATPLEPQTLHGLQVQAPGTLEEAVSARGALEKAIARAPSIGDAQLYLWEGSGRAVSVGHYELVEGGGYDLERGLRGALNRTTRRLGGSPETGPDAYSISATSVSGHRALVGSKAVERGGRSAVVRSLVTRAGRDVWIVSVIGLGSDGFRSFSEAVLGSLRIQL